jgi:hypothetical protein
MLSIQSLKTGQKIDALDDQGDWWSATVRAVAPKRKKPYTSISWDEFPRKPQEKIEASSQRRHRRCHHRDRI